MPETPSPEQIRKAARRYDMRALLDMLVTLSSGTLCLYRAHKQSGPPGYRQYEMQESEIELDASGAFVSDIGAYALLGEIADLCVLREWSWSVGSENSTEFGYHGPAIGAWVEGHGVDLRTTPRAPVTALVAAFVLAVHAERGKAERTASA